ncbi:nuclear transport factor 2 family protein [Actinacidiphila alni]|uniref:nuclear transport factor 2 family protein n=1 Tax=Actinacidiphila alni TaxID=380248 RepID=UPI00345282D8
MNATPTSVPTPDDDRIRAFGARWAAAEQAGDEAALTAMAAADFTLVGPVGFVLDRDQWLHRYGSGDFVTHALTWTVDSVRVHGDTAVVIGVQDQRAAYRGGPADGRFRVTQILTRGAGPEGWQFLGMHLSPVMEHPAP